MLLVCVIISITNKQGGFTMLKNCIKSFTEQINTCLPWYTQMLQQLQQGVSAYKVFNTFEIIIGNSCDVYLSSNIYCLTITTNNGGISTITLNNNKLIIDINYGIEPHNYLNYYNETAI